MYRIKNILQKLTALVLLPVLCSQPALQVSAASNGYSYLLMPTQITKINNNIAFVFISAKFLTYRRFADTSCTLYQECFLTVQIVFQCQQLVVHFTS